MTISIIMPAYNCEAYIGESIQSVISQTYPDWELLIVDDCSTDKTYSLVQKWAKKDNRIQIFQTAQNSGSGVARNIAIHAAKGKYIAFCDSDDWWYPTKLEEQITFMQQNQYPFVCSWYEDCDDTLQPYYTLRQASKQSLHDLIKGCNIGTPGVIYDAQLLGKFTMPSLRKAQDWGLWLTILQATPFIYTYPKVLWKYRHHANSATTHRTKMVQAVVSVYREVLHFSPIKAWGTYSWYFYLLIS